jgi:hypothetical protein
MEQRKIIPTNVKPARPKSSLLSRILNTNSLTSATSIEENNDHNIKNSNNNDNHDSNKLEIISRENYMMNNSFSTPTTIIETYTQLRSEYNNLTQTYSTGSSPRIVVNKQTDEGSNSNDIKIPNRRQSHLYTPYHDRNEFTSTDPATTLTATDYYNSKRRSYYLAPPVDSSLSINNSSLTRSATWQPSTSQYAINNTPGNSNNQPITDIPARRASRNYANNPEIQAKLDAMLNSDKAFFLLKTPAYNTSNNTSSVEILPYNNNSNNVNRRSATPGNRSS